MRLPYLSRASASATSTSSLQRRHGGFRFTSIHRVRVRAKMNAAASTYEISKLVSMMFYGNNVQSILFF